MMRYAFGKWKVTMTLVPTGDLATMKNQPVVKWDEHRSRQVYNDYFSCIVIFPHNAPAVFGGLIWFDPLFVGHWLCHIINRM